MGLIYSSADSAQLISALRRNIHSAKEVTSQLTSGSQRIVSAVDGRTLAGAAYTAGKGLFSDLIIPTISRVTNAFNQLEQDVQTYQSADSVIKGEGSYLDEDIIKQKIEIKRAQKSSALTSMTTLNNQIKLANTPEMSAYMGSMRREINTLVDNLEEDIRKLQKKLQALHTFSSSTNGLFSNSLNDLKIAMRGVTILSKTVVMDTGIYILPNGVTVDSFHKPESEITVRTEIINIAGQNCEVYKIYVDGVYDKKQSDELNKLIAEARSQGILDDATKLFHTAGEFFIYNDLYRLIYGKDWLSGDSASRAEALAWLGLTLLPVGKVAQLSKEIKAGNKLLKGVSLTEKELKILNSSKVINTYIAKEVVLENGEIAYKALNGELVESPKYLKLDGTIDWPKANGFVVDKYGNPITKNANLSKGQIIDRYGDSSGTFSSPFENGKKVDYDKRGIPYPESSKPYHQYEVIQDINIENVKNAYNKISVSEKELLRSEMKYYDFTLEDIANPQSGKIAKVFGKGGGTQIKLGTAVDWYEKLGLIKEIK